MIRVALIVLLLLPLPAIAPEAVSRDIKCDTFGDTQNAQVHGGIRNATSDVRQPCDTKRDTGRWVWCRITRYCATSWRCKHPRCGGNQYTASGSPAWRAGGVAADPDWLPYGTKVWIEGRWYTCDDCFGREQRYEDRRRGIKHLDIRVGGLKHKEVEGLGESWCWVWVEK